MNKLLGWIAILQLGGPTRQPNFAIAADVWLVSIVHAIIDVRIKGCVCIDVSDVAKCDTEVQMAQPVRFYMEQRALGRM